MSGPAPRQANLAEKIKKIETTAKFGDASAKSKRKEQRTTQAPPYAARKLGGGRRLKQARAARLKRPARQPSDSANVRFGEQAPQKSRNEGNSWGNDELTPSVQEGTFGERSTPVHEAKADSARSMQQEKKPAVDVAADNTTSPPKRTPRKETPTILHSGRDAELRSVVQNKLRHEEGHGKRAEILEQAKTSNEQGKSGGTRQRFIRHGKLTADEVVIESAFTVSFA